MSFASHVVVGVLAASVCLSLSMPASADVQACLNASEKGQKLRSSGKLREARENFVICGAEACPALIRHDCSQWNSDLASTLPTVVFGARDKGGKDLFDVTITMDNEVLVKKLDGKQVTVDPGKHVFTFEAAGFPAVTETDLIKEGEKARAINVTFDPDATPGTAPKSGPNSSGVDTNSGHTILPWVMVGVGGAALIAGVVIFATAPDRPSNCNTTSQKCTRNPEESDADLAADKDRAGTADSQPVLGAIVGGVGLALVVGGLVWHFLEPTTSKSAKSALKLVPWTTGKSSGVTVGATF